MNHASNAMAHENKIRRWTAFTPPQCTAYAAHCGLVLHWRAYQSVHPEFLRGHLKDKYPKTPFASRIGRAAQFRCGCRISPSALSTHSATVTAGVAGRWETATYKPSISDLEELARFFKVPITAFFPDIQPSSQMDALLSATRGLDREDLEEVTLYARFRRARQSKRRR